jgi:hypothetical protein
MAEKAKKAETTAENIETTATTEKAKKAENKVYKFTSENKYLSCVSLGVQFINGTATTSNLEVARALTKIEGVTLVED